MNGRLFCWMALTSLLMVGEGWADKRQVAQDRVERDALLFQQKCTACHDIQISLSGCYYLPSEIVALVERMAGYNEASIGCCARDTIINFLTYYEATQRKEQVNRALYCLDEWGREAQLRSIRSVLDYYRGNSFGCEPCVVEQSGRAEAGKAANLEGELHPAEGAVAWESGPINCAASQDLSVDQLGVEVQSGRDELPQRHIRGNFIRRLISFIGRSKEASRPLSVENQRVSHLDGASSD